MFGFFRKKKPVVQVDPPTPMSPSSKRAARWTVAIEPVGDGLCHAMLMWRDSQTVWTKRFRAIPHNRKVIVQMGEAAWGDMPEPIRKSLVEAVDKAW